MPDIHDNPTGEDIYLAIEAIPESACALICLTPNAFEMVWKFICGKLPAAIHLGDPPHEFTINGCTVRNGTGVT